MSHPYIERLTAQLDMGDLGQTGRVFVLDNFQDGFSGQFGLRLDHGLSSPGAPLTLAE